MSSINRRQFLGTTAAGLAALTPTPTPARHVAAADDDPLGVRADFPVVRSGRTYLNTASFSPIPTAVKDAGLAFLDDKMHGRYRNHEKKAEARRRFAELFGVKEQEIALVYSTTDGENIVARALDFKSGDNVVVDALHFTSSLVLYRELERRHGVELRIVPHVDGRTRLEEYDARLDGRTKLVSVAWVSNRNGFRQDLSALTDHAHRKGALVYADAIQALGYCPVDLAAEGVDFASSGSYKWLLGSRGVAVFYVREEHLDRIGSDRYGHGQVLKELSDLRYELKETAEKYEYANAAGGPMYHLSAGLEYLKKTGLSRIEGHTIALAAELRRAVVALGFTPFTPENNATPIVSFEHGHDPEALSEMLRKEDIAVTLREGGHLLRAGIALFNNREDIGRLVSLMEKIA